jgi:hypothetical protein
MWTFDVVRKVLSQLPYGVWRAKQSYYHKVLSEDTNHRALSYSATNSWSKRKSSEEVLKFPSYISYLF